MTDRLRVPGERATPIEWPEFWEQVVVSKAHKRGISLEAARAQLNDFLENATDEEWRAAKAKIFGELAEIRRRSIQ